MDLNIINNMDQITLKWRNYHYLYFNQIEMLAQFYIIELIFKLNCLEYFRNILLTCFYFKIFVSCIY
jgi:hypothetical protein